MLYTTLKKIRACNPCSHGWTKLLKHLGKTKADDEPLSFLTILESNGLDDALWCARSAPEHDRFWRLLAVTYARNVQHLMRDHRSINAIDVAGRHANGQATDKELDAAWEAAGAAAWEAAGAAAWDAAGAAARDVARDAARDAARAAAGAAAGDAAGDAAWAVARDAARAAAWDAWAAGDAPWAAARAKQETQFKETVK